MGAQVAPQGAHVCSRSLWQRVAEAATGQLHLASAADERCLAHADLKRPRSRVGETHHACGDEELAFADGAVCSKPMAPV